MTPDAMPPISLDGEQKTTREVLKLIAALHPLTIRDGRIAIPESVSPELREKILRYEPELLWARGYESGDTWGRAVPGRLYNTSSRPFPRGGPTPVGAEPSRKGG